MRTHATPSGFATYRRLEMRPGRSRRLRTGAIALTAVTNTLMTRARLVVCSQWNASADPNGARTTRPYVLRGSLHRVSHLTTHRGLNRGHPDAPGPPRRGAPAKHRRRLAANVVVAVAKLAAGLITGCSALLSDAVHSAADSINEVLLSTRQTNMMEAR